MKRHAKAEWRGDLKSGKGNISTDSGVLANARYSFGTRFEEGKGTNPEELIAAAHAGCYSMALSMILGKAGFTATQINTSAAVSLEQVDGGFSITAVHLVVKAVVPGADDAAFQKAAADAKTGCPVSKVLNAGITLEASLGS
ncbi:OsmC family protein [Woeseia oceani]|uniref:OsmC family peroxiredoxin n=1 Tax=Woeseia oceani TaxID=1548547 RepID=A0A193LJ06_9GAMM|nr:OsmC family protein [Woeseia oceani]ANO52492.1 OsmC family peroxiredoxin [Woeseia oceani]